MRIAKGTGSAQVLTSIGSTAACKYGTACIDLRDVREMADGQLVLHASSLKPSLESMKQIMSSEMLMTESV